MCFKSIFKRAEEGASTGDREGQECGRVPTVAGHPSTHRGYNGNRQALTEGPALTGPACDHSCFCPHVLFESAPSLPGQWKKLPICLADMNGFSVIPGILLGVGSMHGAGPPFGGARHLITGRLSRASPLRASPALRLRWDAGPSAAGPEKADFRRAAASASCFTGLRRPQTTMPAPS